MAARPPGPSLLPFIGLGMELQRDMLGFLRRTARDHGKLAYLGRLGPTPAYLVADPELAGEVLQTRWREFVRDDVLLAAGGPVFGRGLLFAEGELWLMLRRTMQPAFTRERLAGLVEQIREQVELHCQRWEQHTSSGPPIAMATEMARLTQEVFERAMFGASVGPRIDELLASWTGVNEYVTNRILSPIRLPGHWPTPTNRALRRRVAVIDEIVRPLIDARRRELAEGREHHDLLGFLLAARDPETGEALDDALLRDQILMTFFAGFETTSTALTWLWILLARHPEVEARVHAELDEVLGDRPPTADDLPKLRYLQQVLDETLRLYPSAFMLARQGVGELELGGYRIDAGAVVFVSPYVIHRDARLWPDPDRFDPDRFAVDAPPRERFAFIPFGAGPRLCIGKQLALLESKLIVATIARRYRPRTLPGVEYRSRPLFTLHIDGGANMQIERRNRRSTPL